MLLAGDLSTATSAYAMFHALSRGGAHSTTELVTSTTTPELAQPSEPPNTVASQFASTTPDPGTASVPDADDRVSFRLEVVDTSGNVVNTLNVGDSFELRGYAQDIRTDGTGVFGAFMDVTFDASLATTTGNFDHGSVFNNGTSGTSSSPGLLDEVGGLSGLTPTGTGELFVFSIPLEATSNGTLTFISNPADTSPLHDVLLFDDSATSVAASNIDFGSVSVDIESDAPIDHIAFAKALAAANVTMYGAGWCPNCTSQKELFQDGQSFLPFVEVTNPDRTPNQIAIDEQIDVYPTWERADGTRLEGVQTLEAIAEFHRCRHPNGRRTDVAPYW